MRDFIQITKCAVEKYFQIKHQTSLLLKLMRTDDSCWIHTSATYVSVIGGPRIGLKRSPMLCTTVLKTLNRAASFGRDTVGGGISSSPDSPDT